MLISGLDLINFPVMSLQTGVEVAHTATAVINPHDLSIIAYEVAGQNLDQHPSLLRTADIREISHVGMIIDSSDELVAADDIIKLHDIYEIGFQLIGKAVLNESRGRVGKVIDYNVTLTDFSIEQLNVRRPLLKSLNDSELLIHRSQVIEVTDDAIVIKEKASSDTRLPKSSRSYVNPFRQARPQAESIDRKSA